MHDLTEYIKVEMKKIILFTLLALLCPLSISAQSSMTDDQVMQLVLQEHEKGSSQSQIVTKLMQSGVDIQQIRRVKSKYDRQIKQSGLGNVADKAVTKAEDRMRQNNEKMNESRSTKTTSRVQGLTEYQKTYDENDEDFLMMEEELNGLLPTDSIAWLNKILENQKKNKNKVYGRDIFNQKDLSFEPNMNIATPQNYRLGPGDAVYIDIYGASAKQIESTVSPDGFINIEGFGPVQVSGLTVSQANARLRSTLGSRYSSSNVKLTVGQTRTILVNIMGEVNKPGTYTLSAFSSVFHALYMAGGINDIGTLRNIKVYRNNKLVSVVDIYDYIQNGQQSGNIRLADNDFIIVGPYDCLVNISGKIKRPMYYEMKKNESVGTLLRYAGGFTGDAYKKSVRLIRKTGREYSVFNVEEFRFFMLIPEACKLVLEAGTMGKGGEIFVFDMGKPVKIADLAKRMILLSGAQNIEIKYTGLRPGEKLYEEVLSNDENTKPSFHEKIRIASVREYDYDSVCKDIDELIAISHGEDDMATVKKMKEIVPEYKSNNSIYSALD